jgi:hypothetical protein
LKEEDIPRTHSIGLIFEAIGITGDVDVEIGEIVHAGCGTQQIDHSREYTIINCEGEVFWLSLPRLSGGQSIRHALSRQVSRYLWKTIVTFLKGERCAFRYMREIGNEELLLVLKYFI